MVLSNLPFGIALHLGHCQGHVHPIAFAGSYKVPLQLVTCWEASYVLLIMRHEVAFTGGTSHIHANDGFRPWNGVAQLSLANRIGRD